MGVRGGVVKLWEDDELWGRKDGELWVDMMNCGEEMVNWGGEEMVNCENEKRKNVGMRNGEFFVGNISSEVLHNAIQSVG